MSSGSGAKILKKHSDAPSDSGTVSLEVIVWNTIIEKT